MTAGVHDAGGHADVYSELCPCRGLLDLIANKWSALAIGALDEGPRRFGDLRPTLGGVTPKVLTATLRRLEQARLIIRTVLPEVPLHVEYELTALGRSAAVPLAAMRQWAQANLASAQQLAQDLASQGPPEGHHPRSSRSAAA